MKILGDSVSNSLFNVQLSRFSGLFHHSQKVYTLEIIPYLWGHARKDNYKNKEKRTKFIWKKKKLSQNVLRSQIFSLRNLRISAYVHPTKGLKTKGLKTCWKLKQEETFFSQNHAFAATVEVNQGIDPTMNDLNPSLQKLSFCRSSAEFKNVQFFRFWCLFHFWSILTVFWSLSRGLSVEDT